MNYFSIFRAHGAVVMFGFLFSFLSSFGQTYFVALSTPDIRNAFDLSHGEFGAVFSAATLTAGLFLIVIGSTLDRVSPRAYAAASLAGLAIAALTLSLAQNIALLGLALFGLRLFGQGTLSHASITSTARLPLGVRGRAMGFANLGFQTGAAAFPAAGVALMTTFGWLGMWRIAAIIAAVFAVLVFPYARGVVEAPLKHAATQSQAKHRRRDIIRDWRFLVLLPTMLGPPAITTGYFFHQRFLADDKSWSLDLLALSITASALASVISSIVVGALIDRFGAIRISRFQLLPLAACSLALGPMSGPASAIWFFALLGITSGANGVVITAALAEIYGAGQIGMIRAVAQSLQVIASAISPVVMGYAFDLHVALATIGGVAAVYLVAAAAATLLLKPKPLLP
ncbi:MFS transporter [Terrarubrum flagellatum]|uniref:MFS transporter n=1 Tax=Terrirubrum flagellatum TaxID=2895980 RepID=UPI0031451889